MTTMRAKFEVNKVQQTVTRIHSQTYDPVQKTFIPLVTDKITCEMVRMSPVGSKYDEDGNSEDNTYARWSPSGELTLTITNPDLFDKIKPAQKYYLDFTEVK